MQKAEQLESGLISETKKKNKKEKNKFSSHSWLCSYLVGFLVPGALALLYWSVLHSELEGGGDVGEIVNVSEFLPERAQDAREAARVKDDTVLPGVESYAAFATVDKEKGNHLFWWYLAPTDVQEGERFNVLVWLQGGPGASSLFGMFSEFGPFKLRKDLSLEPREVNWNKKHGLLFIDNPVGTGFSFSDTDSYCTSAKGDVADQLFALLEQFYTLFPELKTGADLYITGESYAGHWVPGLGYKLMKEVEQGSDIPFKGISLGNAWVDPVSQLAGYPELLYNLGLITTMERKRVQEYCDRAVEAVKEGRFRDAFLVWDEMLFGQVYGYPNYFLNVTGLSDYYNYLNTQEPAYEDYFSDYVQLNHVRRAIHVGARPFGKTSKQVKQHLQEDFMVSLREEVEALLAKSYKVLIYNGQLDIIINPVLTRRYIDVMQWPGLEEYLAEPQKVWRLHANSRRVQGYVKQAGYLTSAVVRGAGHMVPSDQPKAALDLITRWVNDQDF